jgi:hypothetical protein
MSGTLLAVPDAQPSLRRIYSAWWPLAASWLFMGLELPFVSAVMARLENPEIHLAAYGGVVFPVALIIEAPIIMLLAASTALSKDERSYWKIHRFMNWAGGLLTLLHALLAFTPLFDLVIVALLNPPAEIIEPARIGFMIMLPWTWTIAYRRFNQGVLIRFGHSKAVTIGTATRFGAVIGTVAITTLIGGLPGIVVATTAIAAGVSAEALYTAFRVRPVVRGPLHDAPAVQPPLKWDAFYGFYIPLALTSLLLLLVQPIGSAAIARMPQALSSLAAWPVLAGLLFMFRSLGYAYNEVVVAWLDEPNSLPYLRRFTMVLAGATAVAMILVAVTPAADFWFVTVSGLTPELADLARQALWIGLLWAPLDVVRNYYQGTLVYGRKTRGITESVAVFLVVSGILLIAGVYVRVLPGLVVALFAFVSGTIAQIAWLWWRSRPVIAGLGSAPSAAVRPVHD